MSDCLHTLFSAWGLDDPDDRARVTASVADPDMVYIDPNVSAPITTRNGYLAYIATFGEGMPGASARVVAVSEHHDHMRAAIEFCKDGEAMMQGQYFAEIEYGKVKKLVGFTGMGEPE
jgi:hypothetical protein